MKPERSTGRKIIIYIHILHRTRTMPDKTHISYINTPSSKYIQWSKKKKMRLITSRYKGCKRIFLEFFFLTYMYFSMTLAHLKSVNNFILNRCTTSFLLFITLIPVIVYMRIGKRLLSEKVDSIKKSSDFRRAICVPMRVNAHYEV